MGVESSRVSIRFKGDLLSPLHQVGRDDDERGGLDDDRERYQQGRVQEEALGEHRDQVVAPGV